jgi:putative flavoprotein involved in K+ transport
MNNFDVIIVGAGAAGIGIAVALKDFGISNFIILERNEIGSSFKKWPKETKFLTPSFQSTQFGLLDLNAIAINTSPALITGLEHCTGEEYVKYLIAISRSYKLPILNRTNVLDVQVKNDIFKVKSNRKTYNCRFLIWAAGEFQYPLDKVFRGSELCLHTSHIKSFTDLKGGDYIIIGGYESGMDVALNLVKLGKEVTVIDKNQMRPHHSQDPSITLSQYTNQRILEEENTDAINFIEGEEIAKVIRIDDGKYYVYNEDGDFYETRNQPILATGFRGGHRLIKELFHYSYNDKPILTPEDESTITDNLFLVGPHVHHDKSIFCFIYKFRQRFGIVANTIATRLNLDTEDAKAHYSKNQMYLDDLTCCQMDCIC